MAAPAAHPAANHAAEAGEKSPEETLLPKLEEAAARGAFDASPLESG